MKNSREQIIDALLHGEIDKLESMQRSSEILDVLRNNNLWPSILESQEYEKTARWIGGMFPEYTNDLTSSNNYRDFAEAAKCGNIKAIKLMAVMDPSHIHEMISADGYLSFIAAAGNGHLDALKLIVELDPEHINEMIAIGARLEILAPNEDIVQRLMEKTTADFPRAGNVLLVTEGYAVAICAAFNGHLDVLKFLMTIDPEHNHEMISERNYSIFNNAVEHGNIELITFIAQKLTQLQLHEMISHDNYDTYLKATKKGQREIAELIKQLDSSHTREMDSVINYDAFVKAAAIGSLLEMERLIELDHDGIYKLEKATWYNAFIKAASEGHVETIKFMANLVGTSNIHEMVSTLHYTAVSTAIDQNNMQVVKLLIELDKDHINDMISYHNYAIFHHAIRSEYIEIIKLLMNFDKDHVNDMISSSDYQAFKSAAYNENVEVMRLLAKAAPNLIHEMISEGNYRVVSYTAEKAYMKALKFIVMLDPEHINEIIQAIDKEVLQGLVITKKEGFAAFLSITLSVLDPNKQQEVLHIIKEKLNNELPHEEAYYLNQAQRIKILEDAGIDILDKDVMDNISNLKLTSKDIRESFKLDNKSLPDDMFLHIVEYLTGSDSTKPEFTKVLQSDVMKQPTQRQGSSVSDTVDMSSVAVKRKSSEVPSEETGSIKKSKLDNIDNQESSSSVTHDSQQTLSQGTNKLCNNIDQNRIEIKSSTVHKENKKSIDQFDDVGLNKQENKNPLESLVEKIISQLKDLPDWMQEQIMNSESFKEFLKQIDYSENSTSEVLKYLDKTLEERAKEDFSHNKESYRLDTDSEAKVSINDSYNDTLEKPQQDVVLEPEVLSKITTPDLPLGSSIISTLGICLLGSTEGTNKMSSDHHVNLGIFPCAAKVAYDAWQYFEYDFGHNELVNPGLSDSPDNEIYREFD